MWLDPKYELDRVVADRDVMNGTGREALAHVSIERLPGDDPTLGIAVAANGFMLAIVPCILLPEDVPGLIRVEWLDLLASTDVDLMLGEDAATLPIDQPEWVRLEDWERPTGTFPNWRTIMRSRPLDLGISRVLVFNPLALADLAAALGSPQSVYLSCGGDDSPILVEPGRSDSPVAPTGLVPPYGVLMPQKSERPLFTTPATATKGAA